MDNLNTLTPSARGLTGVQDLRLVRAKRDNRTKRAFSTGLVRTKRTKCTKPNVLNNVLKVMAKNHR